MLKELKYKILIVSSSEKFNNNISKMFSHTVIDMIDYASNASIARRLLLERSYEIIIIDSPLVGKGAVALAIDSAEIYGLGVILFTPNELYHEVFFKTHELGIMAIAKPASGDTFLQVFSLICSSRERIRSLNTKEESFKDKMEVIKLVNEAKVLLIEHKHYSEEQAHKYIERQAMQLRITKKASAIMVIEMLKEV